MDLKDLLWFLLEKKETLEDGSVVYTYNTDEKLIEFLNDNKNAELLLKMKEDCSKKEFNYITFKVKAKIAFKRMLSRKDQEDTLKGSLKCINRAYEEMNKICNIITIRELYSDLPF